MHVLSSHPFSGLWCICEFPFMSPVTTFNNRNLSIWDLHWAYFGMIWYFPVTNHLQGEIQLLTVKNIKNVIAVSIKEIFLTWQVKLLNCSKKLQDRRHRKKKWNERKISIFFWAELIISNIASLVGKWVCMITVALQKTIVATTFPWNT